MVLVFIRSGPPLFDELQLIQSVLNDSDRVNTNLLSLLQVLYHFFVGKTLLKNLLLLPLVLTLLLNFPQERGPVTVSA